MNTSHFNFMKSLHIQVVTMMFISALIVMFFIYVGKVLDMPFDMPFTFLR